MREQRDMIGSGMSFGGGRMVLNMLSHCTNTYGGPVSGANSGGKMEAQKMNLIFGMRIIARRMSALACLPRNI